MSLKSIKFFNFFASSYFSENSSTNFFKLSNTLYIFNISSFASCDVYCKTKLLNSFLILSLTSFTSFFKSNVTFLSIGHLGHITEFVLSNASSHEFVFIDFKLLISSSKTLENFSNSSNFNVSFFIFSNFFIITCMVFFKLSKIIFPHIVLAKSMFLSILNSFTFSSIHFSGNGLLCMYLYISNTNSCNFSSPL